MTCQPLRLRAGLSHVHLEHPFHTKNAPLTEGQENRDRSSPQVALRLTPWTSGYARAAFSLRLRG